MPRFGNNGVNGLGSGTQSTSFVRHLREFIGETVTIFTTSGGASGCGFTGVILTVNPCFVRLVSEQGTPPTNPLAQNICPDMNNGGDSRGGIGLGNTGLLGRGNGCGHNHTSTGAVVDIPIDRIAAFTHNAI